MAKYRSVVLGCRGRSNKHVIPYKFVDRAEMVACCDMVDDVREKFCKKYDIKGYADPREMIEKEKPDLIHIVTRPSTRVDLLTLISDMGVPACIVEKPIATESKDWKKLCELEKKTKTKIGIGAQFRYHNDMTRCREALASGKLGAPLFMESTAGSTMCDQGVHVLDWAMSLNNDSPVTRVFGTASGDSEIETKHPSPDNTNATLTFANDVQCRWTLGTEAPRVKCVYDQPERYSHCRVAVYCEKGRVLYEEFGKWEIVSPEGIESGHNANMDERNAGNDRAQANLTNAMFDWLEDDSKIVGTHFKRALAQWNVILGLYASAVYRKPIEVPFDPPDDLFEQLVEFVKK